MSSWYSRFRTTRSTWQNWTRLGLLLFALSALSSCGTSDAQSTRSNRDQGAIPVVASLVKRQTVPLLIKTTGNVQAYSTISVKSQIDGQLIGVYFKEGQMVNQGDLLFRIDSRLLQANLEQALAQVAKAQAQVSQAQAEVTQAKTQVLQAKANQTKNIAQAKQAQVQAQRYSSLLRQGAVSRDQAEQFQTTATTQQALVAAGQSDVDNAVAAIASATANVKNAQAEVSAAQAQVDNAKVQLSYTSIYSPNDGRLGTLNVNQGNLVKANDTTPLVTISQVRPIYVEFAIPQNQLNQVKQYQTQGGLIVTASPQNSDQSSQGKLVFIDSGVDQSTGTIKLKAVFPNTDGRLTPGQFVNVVLKLKEQPNALIVPAPAVQAGQQGSFVYVIKSDETVEARPVQTGQTIGNQTVIETGLQEGDRIVVDGQFNLAPGARVQEKSANQQGSMP